MASKALLRRKKEEKKISKKLVVPKEQEQMEKCPVFKVHYLGKIPARGEYGREYIDEPVETLMKLKDRQSKLPKTVLQITERGFHFLDVNGPFGKEKHVLIPIHHVCYGVADEQNPQVFAMITRTDSNPENSLLECHAFLCDRRKVAAQITYWLLRTFLHVFEDLQRRRRERQERKLRRQTADTIDNPANQIGGLQDIPPSSPTETVAPDIYSITLEGSKENGGVTAVSLTRKKNPSIGKKVEARGNAVPTGSPRTSGGKKFATVPAMRIGANNDPSGGGGTRWRQPVQPMHNSHESLNYHPPLKVSVSAGPPVAPRRPQPGDANSSRPHSFNEGRANIPHKNDPRAVSQPLEVQPLEMNGLSNPNAPLHHQQQERVRYMKNPHIIRASPAKIPVNRRANRPLSSTGSSPSSAGSSGPRSYVSKEETDFIFIQMLQEEFSVVDGGSSDSNSTVRRVTGPYSSQDRHLIPGAGSVSNSVAAPPLDQKLSSQDIEKRIREWLKRTSPDAENVSFDDSGLDRISLAGTLANHNSQRAAADTSRFVPSTRPPLSQMDRKSVAGTFNHMPSDREYF